MNKAKETNTVIKTPAQKFFEQVRLLDTGADWKGVEKVFNEKDNILDRFAEQIISEVNEAVDKIGEDYGVPLRKEIYLGLTPDMPGPEPYLAIEYLKMSLLKELEHMGVVMDLREIRKDDVQDGLQCLLDYAEISFYPSKLRKHLEENKGQIPSADKPSNFYITKDRNDDFRYNGMLLDKIGKSTDYYKVFDTLYNLVPESGLVSYKKLDQEIRKRIPKTQRFSVEDMRTFIQNKLDRHNGFLHYAKGVPATIPGGKELIHVVREEGIEFNNRKGT